MRLYSIKRGLLDITRPSWQGTKLVQGKSTPKPDVFAAIKFALSGDVLAGRLVGKVGIKGAPDDPSHGLPGLKEFPRLARYRIQRVAEPLPHITRHLVDAVGSGAGGVFANRDGLADARRRQIEPGRLEHVAPGISVAHSSAELFRPAAGLLPLGGGGQALADPSRERDGLVPADAHDRMLGLGRGKFAVLPVPRARLSRAVGEASDARPDLGGPDLEVVISSRLDEFLVLPVGDGIAVEVESLEIEAREVAIAEDQGDAAGRNQRHLRIERLPGVACIVLGNLADGLLEQDEAVAILRDQAAGHPAELVSSLVAGRDSDIGIRGGRPG